MPSKSSSLLCLFAGAVITASSCHLRRKQEGIGLMAMFVMKTRHTKTIVSKAFRVI